MSPLPKEMKLLKASRTWLVISRESFFGLAFLFLFQFMIINPGAKAMTLYPVNQWFFYMLFFSLLLFNFLKIFTQHDLSLPVKVPLHHRSIRFHRSFNRFLFVFYLLFIFVLFRAAPTAYGGCQARGWIRVAATGLHHSHSNAGSEPPLRPTSQLMATPGP